MHTVESMNEPNCNTSNKFATVNVRVCMDMCMQVLSNQVIPLLWNR